MKFLFALPVFVLMVSIGMSLQLPELVARWKSLTWSAWLRLLLATFIVPPVFVLLLHRLIPQRPAEAIGLFMVAVVPGAPLVSRKIARHGFDMNLAASYQVWGAVLPWEESTSASLNIVMICSDHYNWQLSVIHLFEIV